MERRKRAPIAAVIAGLLGLTAFTPAPATADPVACDDGAKPVVVPVEDLTPGTMGTAWTAIEGRTPVDFEVEVLGTLEDGIAPGIDFILIKVSGPVIDQTGGIAAGMSGSPVYVNGDLAGAISYGFYGGDPTIGGMTPAASMVELFDQDSSPPIPPTDYSVEVPLALRRAAAAATGSTASAVPAEADPLPMPLMISGTPGPHLDRLEQELSTRLDMDVQLIPGNSVDGSLAPGDPIQPGEPLAAAMSTGLVTTGGIGTATAVCNDEVVAWGHPFFWFGRTSYGMYAADILTVVPDASGIWGPFKLGSIAEPVGQIDLDRMAALHGTYGSDAVTWIDVSSAMYNADNDTEFAFQSQMVDSGWILNELVGVHAMSSVDHSLDSWWEGTGQLTYVIEGTRENGNAFTFTYDTAYWDDYWMSLYPLFDMWDIMWLLNSFEDITITSVHMEGSVSQDWRAEKVKDVSLAGGAAASRGGMPSVKAGKEVTLDVELKASDGSTVERELLVTVPRGASGPTDLWVHGGWCGSSWCSSRWMYRMGRDGNLNRFIRAAEKAVNGNELFASLSKRETGRPLDTALKTDLIIYGSEKITVDVK